MLIYSRPALRSTHVKIPYCFYLPRGGVRGGGVQVQTTPALRARAGGRGRAPPAELSNPLRRIIIHEPSQQLIFLPKTKRLLESRVWLPRRSVSFTQSLREKDAVICEAGHFDPDFTVPAYRCDEHLQT